MKKGTADSKVAPSRLEDCEIDMAPVFVEDRVFFKLFQVFNLPCDHMNKESFSFMVRAS